MILIKASHSLAFIIPREFSVTEIKSLQWNNEDFVVSQNKTLLDYPCEGIPVMRSSAKPFTGSRT